MSRVHYPEENGKIVIMGHKMSWTMRRSKSESAFGIRGSRIFELKLWRDGILVAEYDRGWIKTPNGEDEAANCCIPYLADKYGRSEKAKKKEKEHHD